MKRYDLEQYEGDWANMVEREDGDYVEYDDVRELLAKLARYEEALGNIAMHFLELKLDEQLYGILMSRGHVEDVYKYIAVQALKEVSNG